MNGAGDLGYLSFTPRLHLRLVGFFIELFAVGFDQWSYASSIHWSNIGPYGTGFSPYAAGGADQLVFQRVFVAIA